MGRKHKKQQGHLATTGSGGPLPWQRQGPRAADMELAVMDGDVKVAAKRLQAFGIRTCAFVVVETRQHVIGWHASGFNAPGNPKASAMPAVLSAFRSVSDEGFVRGFVVPGTELGGDLRTREDSEFASLFGISGSDALQRIVAGVGSEFPWWPRLAATAPVEDEGDVVEYTRGSSAPVIFRNPMFSAGTEGLLSAMANLGRLARDKPTSTPNRCDQSIKLAVGDRVRLHGLRSAPHLNGMEGVCECWSAEQSRWGVRLPGGELKALKTESLLVVSAEDKLAQGVTVCLHGLRGAPELNGERGSCETWDPETQRWSVRLASGPVKAVKPVNLCPVTGDLAPACPAPSKLDVRPLQDDGKFGVFCTSGAAAGAVVVEEHPLVYHELPDERSCEGCAFKGPASVACEKCHARFCSVACRERSWTAWHQASCGDAFAEKAEAFCDGRAELGGVMPRLPWRAGMGGLKMMLSLLCAAKRGRAEFEDLAKTYQQMHVSPLKVAAMKDRPEVAPLWNCWLALMGGSRHGGERPLVARPPFNALDTFAALIAKYNTINQGGGLFRFQSFCQHSCRPNVAVRDVGFEGAGSPLKLLAVRPLSPGTQLLATFVNPRAGRDERRCELIQTYGIDCQCPRCSGGDDGIPPEELRLLDPGPAQCAAM